MAAFCLLINALHYVKMIYRCKFTSSKKGKRMKTIFLSAELSTLDSAENARRSNILLGHLITKGYNFKPLVGVYKGSKEKSFAIEVNGKELIDLMIVAKSFSQESILEVDGKNTAFLTYLNDKKRVKLGKFRIASKEVAEKQGSYSFDSDTGRYFVVQ